MDKQAKAVSTGQWTKKNIMKTGKRHSLKPNQKRKRKAKGNLNE